MDHIIDLHLDCTTRRYRHGEYMHFRINDPKPRDIHKASVRDRLLHHAMHRVLYSFFDRRFIADSFSCRIGKGTHRALDRFRSFAYQVSHNHTRTGWVLQCDIRKFFASVDHAILFNILRGYALDKETLWLLREVVGSFSTRPGVGLPLGNLTSQILVNVYMNEFDQWVKHTLRARGYIRYADDFVFFSSDHAALVRALPRISHFLRERLRLMLHPKKVRIRMIASGIDFLGWVHFPDHRILRTTTKRRMLRRIKKHNAQATLQSYRGLLGHGNAHKLGTMVDFSSGV
jgi:RNA-directed DNA polymerase